jgi:hypothetical protein
MQAVETLRITHSPTMNQDDRAGSVLMGGVESTKNIHDSFLNLQATPPTHYHYKRRVESGASTPPNLYDGVFLAATGEPQRIPIPSSSKMLTLTLPAFANLRVADKATTHRGKKQAAPHTDAIRKSVRSCRNCWSNRKS